MIVRASQSGVSVEEADNLKAFKLTAPTALRSTLSSALGAAGRVDGEAVWVSEAWLRAQTAAQPVAWRADFDKMIAFAKSKGWYDEASEAIRAHIEWDA